MANIKEEILSWMMPIIFAVLFALTINNFIIVNARVPSGSMENTIMTGDRIMAFRLSYLFSEPERFDIVVFKFPDDESVLFVKRIIGLPGETVDIKNGQVYIDSSPEPLDTSFLKEEQWVEEDARFVVPNDSYFMLGDNRNRSEDSRRWNNKYVQRKKILGEVILRYFPFGDIRLF